MSARGAGRPKQAWARREMSVSQRAAFVVNLGLSGIICLFVPED